MSIGSTRVAVFIDWQNVYMTAREAFELEEHPNERGNINPLKLARILSSSNERATSALLTRVEIHRGLPSSNRDPVGNSANRRQAAAWVNSGGGLVVARLRPLRHPSPLLADQRPVEKGIDVQLALAIVETILSDVADIAILFTHDTDLLPAVETIARLKGPDHIETVSWGSPLFSQRLRERPDVYHHRLGEPVFRLVEEPVSYARPAHA